MAEIGRGRGKTPRGEGGAGAEAPPEGGSAAPRSAPVLRPVIEEAVEFDAGRISALFADLGAEGAHATIARAMDALTARLSVLQAAGPDAFEARAKAARRLVGIAEGIGMTTLAAAARAAADAAGQGDAAADAATAARLMRVADRSLAAIADVDAAPA